MSPAQKLLVWYKTNGRTLPWRETRDPYRILISEVMLQQTQVPRVLLFYTRWLKRFPDWASLARASNAQVIRLWAGLGYNRRALALRDIAKQVAVHGVPKNETEWLALKGVGPYTAAALACFSLHERVMPLDTNTRRVLERVLDGRPFPNGSLEQSKATAFLPKSGKFYDVPQALFDLATDICKKNPRCAICPLRGDCKAAKKFLSGKVLIPKTMIKKPIENKHRNKPFPDRIYRGRILAMVRLAPRTLDVLGVLIDPSYDATLDRAWVEAMTDRLVKDGLLARRGRRVTISGEKF